MNIYNFDYVDGTNTYPIIDDVINPYIDNLQQQINTINSDTSNLISNEYLSIFDPNGSYNQYCTIINNSNVGGEIRFFTPLAYNYNVLQQNHNVKIGSDGYLYVYHNLDLTNPLYLQGWKNIEEELSGLFEAKVATIASLAVLGTLVNSVIILARKTAVTVGVLDNVTNAVTADLALAMENLGEASFNMLMNDFLDKISYVGIGIAGVGMLLDALYKAEEHKYILEAISSNVNLTQQEKDKAYLYTSNIYQGNFYNQYNKTSSNLNYILGFTTEKKVDNIINSNLLPYIDITNSSINFSSINPYPSKTFTSQYGETAGTILEQVYFKKRFNLSTSGITYGSGDYILYYSSYYNNSFINCFDNNNTTFGVFNSYYDLSGNYDLFNNAGTINSLGDFDDKGDILIIQLPYKISLNSISLRTDYTYDGCPLQFSIYGGNDLNIWNKLDEVITTTASYPSPNYTFTYTLSTNSDFIQNIGFIFKKTHINAPKIFEIKYYGLEASSRRTIIKNLVGIGTNDPQEKLHIIGNIRNEGFVYTDNLLSYNDIISLGKVGIGSATPNTKLDIVGDSYITGSVGIGTSTLSRKLNVIGNAYFDDVIFIRPNGFFNIPGINALPYSEYSTGERIILYNGDLYSYHRAIGVDVNDIWFSVPTGISYKWYVNGSVKMLLNSTGSLNLLSNDTYISTFKNNNSTYGIGIGTSSLEAIGSSGTQDITIASKSTGNLYLKNNNINSITILGTNNNVGIGSDTPAVKLDVVGNIRSSGNIKSISSSINTTDSTSSLTINNIVIDRNNFDHSSCPLTITHQTPTSDITLNDPQPILNLCRQGTSAKAYGSKACFKLCRYTNSGVSSRTRLDLHLTHNAYDDLNIMSFRSDGNIGIGSTDPTQKLDVNGNIKNNGIIDIYKTTYAQPSTGTLGGNGERLIIKEGGTGIYPYAIGADTNMMWYNTNGSHSHSFCINGVEYANIKTAGLNITADNSLILRVYNASSTYGIGIGTNIIENLAGVQDITLSATSTGNLYFKTNSTNRVIVNSSGNVGIASMTPTEKLDVVGNIKASGNMTASGNITATGNITGTNITAGTAIVAYNMISTDYVFYTNRGTVGAPTIGQYGSTGDRLILWQGSGSVRPYSLGINNSTLWYNSEGVHSFYTSGTEKLTILNNGNVGIGYTSAPYKLTVMNGDIYTNQKFIGMYLQIGSYTGSKSSSLATMIENNNITYLNTSFVALDVCAEFGSSIWVDSRIYVSSDERIKKEVQDINDESALNKILQLKPKSFKYIDNINHGSSNVFGFIAQDVKEIIPEAINIQKNYIPNIYNLCSCYENHIYNSNINFYNLLETSNNIKLYDIKGQEQKCKVNNIISSNCIEIDKNLNSSNIFLYGKEVDDYQVIDDHYIFSLNISATQELNRKIDILTSNFNIALNRIEELEKNKKDK